MLVVHVMVFLDLILLSFRGIGRLHAAFTKKQVADLVLSRLSSIS